MRDEHEGGAVLRPVGRRPQDAYRRNPAKIAPTVERAAYQQTADGVWQWNAACQRTTYCPRRGAVCKVCRKCECEMLWWLQLSPHRTSLDHPISNLRWRQWVTLFPREA